LELRGAFPDFISALGTVPNCIIEKELDLGPARWTRQIAYHFFHLFPAEILSRTLFENHDTIFFIPDEGRLSSQRQFDAGRRI
jgi:hypothetical protein